MRLFRLPLVSALSLVAMLACAPAEETAKKEAADTKKPAGKEAAQPEKKDAKGAKKDDAAKGKYAGWRRVIIQPNGWGQTKKQAISDLDRVMKHYEHRPGFRRDNYVAVVYVGRNKWQADGRCSYLAPPTVRPETKKRRIERKNKATQSGAIGSKTR